MFNSVFPGHNGLCEVLDAQKRPLCLLAQESILKQGLCHRLGAIIGRRNDGRWLLRNYGEAGFGFTWAAIPPAGEAVLEECLRLARDFQAGPLRHLGEFVPCSENGNAFASVFEMPCKSMNAEGILPVDASELGALVRMGYLIQPLALHALQLAAHPRSSSSIT